MATKQEKRDFLLHIQESQIKHSTYTTFLGTLFIITITLGILLWQKDVFFTVILRSIVSSLVMILLSFIGFYVHSHKKTNHLREDPSYCQPKNMVYLPYAVVQFILLLLYIIIVIATFFLLIILK